MTKEELKNKISMALKDPVLQIGFEIICKENAELKKACDETQELLDKQIEATYKVVEENAVLKKALHLYVDWTDECGIGWDNFPDMTEKWYKSVEEKGLGWIDGLIFMVTEEAKEQLKKRRSKNDRKRIKRNNEKRLG